MDRFSFIGLNPGVPDENYEFASPSHLQNDPEKLAEQQVFIHMLVIAYMLVFKMVFLAFVVGFFPPPGATLGEKLFLFTLGVDHKNIEALYTYYQTGVMEESREMSIVYNVAGYVTFSVFYLLFYMFRQPQREGEQAEGQGQVAEANNRDRRDRDEPRDRDGPAGEEAEDDNDGDANDANGGGAGGDQDFQTPAGREAPREQQNGSSPRRRPRGGRQRDDGDGSEVKEAPTGQDEGNAKTEDGKEKTANGHHAPSVELQINGKAVSNGDAAENGLSISFQENGAANGIANGNEANGADIANGHGITDGSGVANGSGVDGSANGYANGDEELDEATIIREREAELRKLVDSLVNSDAQTTSALSRDIPPVSKTAPVSLTATDSSAQVVQQDASGETAVEEDPLVKAHVLADSTGTDYYQKREAEEKVEASAQEAS